MTDEIEAMPPLDLVSAMEIDQKFEELLDCMRCAQLHSLYNRIHEAREAFLHGQED